MRAGGTMTRVEAVPAAVLAAVREAAKAHLRVEQTIEDALIDGYAGAAIGAFEGCCGLIAIARPASETIAATGAWRRLSARPVRAIGAIEAIDAEGVRTALPVSGYAIDIDPDGGGWVRAAPGGRIAVSYEAGLAADWAGLPETARHGIVRLTAHLATHRDRIADPVPAAVSALWRPLRRMRLR